ncbi:hypothetical protein [Sphingosinicella sp. BN140058]|uniref:hypothetical protein n=1 Tax=Sphingosinicella sp. BN140058 TaxID=1892855 RepID=UPI00101165D0|nr:hypothetical protein [Sphingosinicella sp. BN140058]QAY78636.1 hypothetical protein ETR14_20405 [Sphingosinicella sp. BN140058]
MLPLLTLVLLCIMGLGLAAVVAEAQRRKNHLRQTQLEAFGLATAERAALYAAQVERLQQRMRVLEGFAADRGIAAADEIEALKNRPLH